MSRSLLVFAVLLTSCGATGLWRVTTQGESYLEQGMSTDDFTDDCTLLFETFEVQITEAVLLDADGEIAVAAPGGVFDLTAEGPQELGKVDAPADPYTTARIRIAPAAGPSVRTTGNLICGDEGIGVDLAFQTDTTYVCDLDEFAVSKGLFTETRIDIHGQRLFLDSLGDDGELRAGVLHSAGVVGEGDSTLSLDDLAEYQVADFDYDVGSHSEVETLEDFLIAQSRTLVGIDGTGRCRVQP